MVNLVREAQESKKKIILSVLVAVLMLLAVVPLFVLASMLDLAVWARCVLIGVGVLQIVLAVVIACVLDREAGAYECPECGERFVPSMGEYMMALHTITRRRLRCPKCGAKRYCKKVLTKTR